VGPKLGLNATGSLALHWHSILGLPRPQRVAIPTTLSWQSPVGVYP